MTSRGLFTPIFVPEAVQDAVADDAWLRAMLDVEAALAAAQGASPAAEAIAAAQIDLADLGVAARAAGNPVVPLAARLREVSEHAHHGATSQDILDSAAMLVAKRALVPVLTELDGVVARCAALAREHRGTVMAGRTLMQQAEPVTFGLKAAGWLAGVAGARARLRELTLPAQLGGAAGTLAKIDPAVVDDFAARLGLAAPRLPWHGDRRPVAEL
ncbi:MAG TPA: lyase family protein, partial [Solirubrobacteraceae bacterium]|nr:lyase family protein [Solirubrobacteraceae bacterium]